MGDKDKRHYHSVVYNWSKGVSNGLGRIDVNTTNKRPFNRFCQESLCRELKERDSYEVVFISNIIYLGEFTREEFLEDSAEFHTVI